MRLTEHTVLMPSAPGYQTIGEFHEMLTQGFEDVSSAMGEAALLIGRADAATALGRRLGPLGYLARELAADVPGLLRRLTPAERR